MRENMDSLPGSLRGLPGDVQCRFCTSGEVGGQGDCFAHVTVQPDEDGSPGRYPIQVGDGSEPIAAFTGDGDGIGHRSHPFPDLVFICFSICRRGPVGRSPRRMVTQEDPIVAA